MLNEDQIKQICALRSNTVRLEREGKYWELKECDQLRSRFSDGCGITEIALILQRSEPAIMQQIEKLDLFNRHTNPRRRKREKQQECLSSLLKHRKANVNTANIKMNDWRKEVCSMSSTMC